MLGVYESLSVKKYPLEPSKRKRIKPCSKSCFADGVTHRVGLVRVLSLLDGALPGDVAQEVCLECGEWFDYKIFVPTKQPNSLM